MKLLSKASCVQCVALASLLVMVQNVSGQYYPEDDETDDSTVVIIIVIVAVVGFGCCGIRYCFGSFLLNTLIEKDNELPLERRYMMAAKKEHFWCAYCFGGECAIVYYYDVVEEAIDRRLAEHRKQLKEAAATEKAEADATNDLPLAAAV